MIAEYNIETEDYYYYYVMDESGSPILLVDSSGNIKWNQNYFPFGEIKNSSGYREMGWSGMKWDEDAEFYGG